MGEFGRKPMFLISTDRQLRLLGQRCLPVCATPNLAIDHDLWWVRLAARAICPLKATVVLYLPLPRLSHDMVLLLNDTTPGHEDT